MGFRTAFEKPSWKVTQTFRPALYDSSTQPSALFVSLSCGAGCSISRPKKSRLTAASRIALAAAVSSEFLGPLAPSLDALMASDCLRVVALRYSWSSTWRTAYRTGAVPPEASMVLPLIFEKTTSESIGLFEGILALYVSGNI